MATIAVALTGAPTASAQETLAASCVPQTAVFLGTSGQTVAQVFDPQASGGVTRAELALDRDANSVAGFRLWVFGVSSSGVPSGAPLAETFLAASQVQMGGSTRLVPAVFENPAEVVAGRNYALAVARIAGNWQLGTRSDCDHGMFLRPFGSPTWFEQPGTDAAHRIYVTPPRALSCKGRSVTMSGTAGGDELTGTRRRDVIAGRGGGDEIDGLAGNDLICGGSGEDLLRGGKGKDELHGQAGTDKLRGGGGAKDRCIGGENHDSAKRCEVEKRI